MQRILESFHVNIITFTINVSKEKKIASVFFIADLPPDLERWN